MKKPEELTNEELLEEYLRIRNNSNNAYMLMKTYRKALMPYIKEQNEFKTKDFNFKLNYKYSLDAKTVNELSDYNKLREVCGVTKTYLYTTPIIKRVSGIPYIKYTVDNFNPQTIAERYAFYYDSNKKLSKVFNEYRDELAKRYYNGCKKIGDIYYRIVEIKMIDYDRLAEYDPDLFERLMERSHDHAVIDVEHANNDIDYVSDKLVEDGKAEFLACAKESELITKESLRKKYPDICGVIDENKTRNTTLRHLKDLGYDYKLSDLTKLGFVYDRANQRVVYPN